MDVCIFNGKLRFANPWRTTDGLYTCVFDFLAGEKVVIQYGKRLLTTYKVTIVPIWHVPVFTHWGSAVRIRRGDVLTQVIHNFANALDNLDECSISISSGALIDWLAVIGKKL